MFSTTAQSKLKDHVLSSATAFTKHYQKTLTFGGRLFHPQYPHHTEMMAYWEGDGIFHGREEAGCIIEM
jgi:hypothetical protein